MRNHILLQIESAIRASTKAEKEKFANIVIAGGGPTGVEIAGMIAEMAKNIVTKDYPEATPGVGKIYLVDGLPSLLAPMSNKSQYEAYHTLEKLGVQILLNTLVKDYTEQKVILASGQTIPAATLIWASGVIAREANGLPPESITKGRRIVVDSVNRVQGTENIFAIGDQCFQNTDKRYPNGHPQLAQVAIQQGKLLGKNLKLLQKNRELKTFSYHNKGAMPSSRNIKQWWICPKDLLKVC